MFKKIILASILACIQVWLVSAFEASYYSDAFEWKMSANGTIFSQNNHSAAICFEDLSQFAYVSTAQVGMVVSLTDRPNCNRHPDRIDLSSSVFSAFAPLSKGIIQDVSAIPIGINAGKFIKRNISQEEFLPLGISLSVSISNSYFARDSIRLTWRALSNQKHVMTYLEHKKTGKKYSRSYPTSTSGRFDIVLHLPSDPGEYFFVIAEGTSFRTETPASILLVERTVFDVSLSWITPTIQKAPPIKNETVWTSQVLTFGKNTWGIVSLPEKNISSHGQVIHFTDTQLQPQLAAYVFTGYKLSTPSSLDRSPASVFVGSGKVLIDRQYDSLGADRLRVARQASRFTFRFRIPQGKKVETNYYLTLPNGDVRSFQFPDRFRDTTTGYLRTGILIQATFPARDRGTYRLEAVEHDGFAYFNIPLTQWEVWNIIPVFTDEEMRDVTIDPSVVRAHVLRRINTLRWSLSRRGLVEDSLLTRLAQEKALDMAQYGYIGHTTVDGKNIRGFALSLGLDIPSSIWENVAWGNVSGLALQDGLEESGSHRANMLDPAWTKVWVWYVVRSWKTYMVHIFWN